jgi:predicted NBD/HSP70 family sugar kinase
MTSVAVDIRATGTFLMLADPMGQPRSDVVSLPTARQPKRFVTALAARIRQLLEAHGEAAGKCQGIGVVVPGMVDPGTGSVLHAPTLGWRARITISSTTAMGSCGARRSKPR